MPRVSDHLVKSAIRLERQSTTVPNTSNTRAFTAETSDMFPSILLSSFRDAPLGAGPESILTMVVMDSGLALRAPRNDETQSTFLYWMNPRLSATLSYSARAC